MPMSSIFLASIAQNSAIKILVVKLKYLTLFLIARIPRCQRLSRNNYDGARTAHALKPFNLWNPLKIKQYHLCEDLYFPSRKEKN